MARGVFALPCLAIAAVLLRKPISTQAAGWVRLRSLMLVAAWVAYYASLPLLDLATAAVAVYTNPIMTALLAALVLRERVRAQQWLGVVLGFLGIAIILRPGSESFTPALFLPLLSAALYSGAMVLTRAKCRGESFVAMAISLNLWFVIAGLAGLAIIAPMAAGLGQQGTAPFLLGGWNAMTTWDWGIVALLGLITATFTILVARAYQIAPPHIIGTFDYAYVGFAVLWGVVLFSETPDTQTLGGMAMVIGAGLLVARPPRNAASATA